MPHITQEIEQRHVGKTYGLLTVLNHAQGTKWLCRCQCGVRVMVTLDKLKKMKHPRCNNCKRGIEEKK